MRTIKIILVTLMIVPLICGCQSRNTNQMQTPAENNISTAPSSAETAVPDEMVIAVMGKQYSIAEIKQGIQNAFNTELYYSGEYPLLAASNILDKTLEYDLLLMEDIHFPYVLLLVNNLEYPIPIKEEPQNYMFGIAFTDRGMGSYFHVFGPSSPNALTSLMEEKNAKHLGSHSLCISQITEPQHEQTSNEWKQLAETELQRYMNINENGLEPGNYRVYIKGFSKGDTDARIIFEHEQGKIYEGYYYFVHDISGEGPANLNHVELVSEPDEYYMNEYGKIQKNAALVIEYCIE